MSFKIDFHQRLKTQSDLIKFLEQNCYPDSQRISNEIIDFCIDRSENDNDFSTLLSDIKTRIAKSEPWEYISEKCEFCGIDFIVNKDVLIPRVETEQLVEMAEKDIRNIVEKNSNYNLQNRLQVVDVGTGSGAIIISLAFRLRDIVEKVEFSAADISEKALNVARSNFSRISTENFPQISFIESDLIDRINLDKRDVYIVSNLPYIPTKVYEKLDNSVIDYEPRLALEGGPIGTELYERLFEQLKQRAVRALGMILEIDPSIYEAMLKISHKEFSEDVSVEILKDGFEKERFVRIIDTKK